MKSYGLSVLLGLLVGLAVGYGIIRVLPYLDLQKGSYLYTYLGIRKPEIVGFQPFWLLEKAQDDYSPYITSYAFFSLTLGSDGHIVKKNNPQEEEPGWTWLNGSRVQETIEKYNNRGLKRSLILHLSDENDISVLMSNPKFHARNMMNDIVPIMNEYSFHDVNLDIESFKEASPEGQLALTAFVKETRTLLNENDDGKTLAIDISPTAFVKTFLINPREVAPLVDYIVLMAYDYHYSGSTLSGPVAPIGGAGEYREFDVETGLKEALSIIPKEKIILGIPLYGYEWETLDKTPQAATIPGGSSVASSRRIEEMLKSCPSCQRGYDDTAKQPYVIFPDEKGLYYHQIFYENKQSMAEKCTLAEKYEIGGIALWALGYEYKDILDPVKEYKRKIFYTE